MCTREPETRAALESGAWTAELRAHFAACEDCAETALVAGFMQQAAATADADVPDVGLVWWKLQLRARRDAAARAARPLEVAETSAAVAAALALVWAVAWLSSESAAPALIFAAGLSAIAMLAATVYWFAWSRK